MTSDEINRARYFTRFFYSRNGFVLWKCENLPHINEIESNHIKMSHCKFVYRMAAADSVAVLCCAVCMCHCMRAVCFGIMSMFTHVYNANRLTASSTHQTKCIQSEQMMCVRYKDLHTGEGEGEKNSVHCMECCVWSV